VCSAVGLLGAPEAREVVRSYAGTGVQSALAQVAREARALVGADAHVETAVDCRYIGQSHELTVATPADFPAEHERRNGHARPGAPVEIVAVRARATRPAPRAVTELPDVARARVTGPSVVAEADCTVWVPEGWIAEPRELGAWVIERA